MVEYNGPDKRYEAYSSTFIRVGDKIHVSTPGQPTIPHLKLASDDGLYEGIRNLRKNSSPHVDGGIVEVNNSRNTVSVRGISLSFMLPPEGIAKEAREETVNLFAAQAKGYAVINREANPWEVKSISHPMPIELTKASNSSRIGKILRRIRSL